MTPLMSFSPFKKIKIKIAENFILKEEQKLREEFSPAIEIKREEWEQKKKYLEEDIAFKEHDLEIKEREIDGLLENFEIIKKSIEKSIETATEKFNRKQKELELELETKKAKWIEKESLMNQEILEREAFLTRKQEDLEHFILKINSRKIELEEKDDELKQQIAIITAKASPDHVWVTAFGAGFSKAWDMMMPLMMDGVERSKDKIKSQAIDETLRRIHGSH